MARGRTVTQMGQMFGPLVGPGHGPAVTGQPVQVRTWGIPTGSGYRDRPGKWNFDNLRGWFRKLLRRRVRYEVG